MSAPANTPAWRVRLALAGFGSVLSLALGESALRFYEHLEHAHKGAEDTVWRDRVRHMNRTIYRRSSDARLIYEPTPSMWVPMPYGPAGFNAESMRDDREHSREPDPRRPRVAMLGDSLVWSEEVSIEDSLPRRLELDLAASHAEVLNFGVTGYDTAQEAAWFERHARAFRPAVVVVVYCMNDMMIMSGPFNRFATPDEAARKDEQDQLLERLAPLRAETLDDLAARDEASSWFHLFTRTRWAIRHAFYERSADYRDEYTVMFAQPAARARVHDALATLGAAIHASGARAHLVISPVLRDFRHYHWAEIHAWVTDEARRDGFTVADPLETWRAAEHAERLRVPGDSLHYNPDGQRVFAAFIARTLGL